MDHPYRQQPPKAFWNRSVSENFDASAVYSSSPLILGGERIASAGSCFAANIVPYLREAGIEYVVTERPYPAFASVHKEGWSYDKFSAAYGNIYTARQLLQLVKRAIGTFRPKEDRWHIDGGVIDPFRPGLTFVAESDAEFDALTAQHLACVREAIRQADVFVFTLGLTEGWVSAVDGAVFPACPGTVRGQFDPEKHRFVNFSVSDVTSDLGQALALMRLLNPALRFVLTVSPVPLVATATDQHILAATIYSKSVLRVAAQQVCESISDTRYFPAYEIVTGPQAPYEFFTETRRDVSDLAISAVMKALLANCDLGTQTGRPEVFSIAAPATPSTAPTTSGGRADISSLIASVECEEAAIAAS